MADIPQPQQIADAAPPSSANAPPPARVRYPLIYISYQVWVEHKVLFPQGTPAYARHSEDPRTPDNWKYHHECVNSDETDVVPIPPCEVPFEQMSVRDFKRAVIELVGATCTDFDFTSVLTAAEAGRKLQWRGTAEWPGGPVLRNYDVARSFSAFERMATNAVPPKKCHLRLYMEDPIMKPRYPRYWTWIPNRQPDEVWVPFQPNGAPLPPPEVCIVLGGWIRDLPSSTNNSGGSANEVRSPSYHSSSARSDAGWVPPGDSDGTSECSSADGPGLGSASVVANADEHNDEAAANRNTTGLVSSPGFVILDGPPSSWQSRDYTYIRSSSPPEIEVLSTPGRPMRATRNNNN
ncbi:hypothetical protein PGTUg99_009032 [Puccinia graminis f. sp. tritici]|uniref:Uncharacterized protein n=1 Tax=Puccinia graminis f. sp. tritici TaxID=56615 RepID=A0A5B0LLN7_PUCGR|nr:hypothetical protein PGTUg99_009032 [Puccinia graminis f. sp. tritici]